MLTNDSRVCPIVGRRGGAGKVAAPTATAPAAAKRGGDKAASASAATRGGGSKGASKRDKEGANVSGNSPEGKQTRSGPPGRSGRSGPRVGSIPEGAAIMDIDDDEGAEPP